MAGHSFSNKKGGHTQAPTGSGAPASDTSVNGASLSPTTRGRLSDLVAPVGVALFLALSGVEEAQGASNQAKPQTPPSKTPVTQRITEEKEPPFSIYRVEKGDTLSAIAKRFNVTLEYLIATNPDVEEKKMTIGQVVRLPVRPEFHLVKKGESPAGIAAKYGISTKDLLAANPQIKDPRAVQIGARLHLPSPKKVELPKAPEVPHKSTALPVATTPAPQPTAQVSPPSATIIGPKLSAEEAPSFFTYMKRAFGFEGMKITRDSNDPGNQGVGKLTNAGITGVAVVQHILDTEKRQPSASEVNQILERLSLDEAIVIYSTGFWRKDYQLVPEKLAFMMFDWGVNSHPRRVIGRFQEHLNVPKTGIIDQPTVAAINALGENRACQEFLGCRLSFYRARAQEKPSMARYLEGWERRAKGALAFANSREFADLKGVFEKTARRGGCDLLDPVREGHTTLKRGSDEAVLIRLLQERLGKVGYNVTVDGIWAKEMDTAVALFKEKHGLPPVKRRDGVPVGVEWGVQDTQVLDAKLAALQKPRAHGPMLALSPVGTAPARK